MINSTNSMYKFSVLMSIYIKEKPEYFNQAMGSIWDKQTLKPGQIVLVEDGLLTAELYAVIESWHKKLADILTIVKLDKNQGLGRALSVGLRHCRFEWVARMDTDDICAPNRFAKQMEFVTKNSYIDVLGTNMEEFYLSIGDLKTVKLMPEKHNDIVKFSKYRSPINHPTVLYKKTKVLQADSYNNDINLYEDYPLFVRMLLNGCKFHNLQENLLYFRVGDGKAIMKRRSGWGYVKSEFTAIKYFYKLGHLNLWQFMANCALKLPLRMLPAGMLYFIYKKLLRKKADK